MPRPAQRLAALLCALAVAGTFQLASPASARAATYEELVTRVQEASEAYDEAMGHLTQIQADIDENEARISELEAELPTQRERAAESLRILYKMQQSSGGLIDFMLSAEDFNEFIATITYLDRIQAKNVSELQDLNRLSAELQEAKDTLAARHAEASHELDAAAQAQADAVAARDAVIQQALAQAAAEQEAAAQALAEAEKAAAEGKTFTTASGQQAQVTTPSSTETVAEETRTPDKQEQKDEQKPEEQETKQEEQKEESKPAPAPVVSEREAFVSSWASRIDAYLAGSPLGGHGRTFAEAAWDYGVDPRWSPAISCIESSKGAICFRPHNAWGWGNASWGDWDTAIRSHVAGLAATYGYTITPSAAQMYCPPTWQSWYSSVLSQMNSI